VRAVVRLAQRANAAVGRRQITEIDIGGGLPVNFESDDIRPTFAEYASVLRAAVPGACVRRRAATLAWGRDWAQSCLTGRSG
jgi:diaminopimelate decarboxylase